MTSFDTKVAGVRGEWPEPPTRWSYSALTEVEACPRRWALTNASYPEIRDPRGYPRKPTPAAMIGRVVHGSAEAILNALTDAECTGLRDPSSAIVIRRIGGISGVIDAQLNAEIETLRDNPRATRMIDVLERHLREHVPSMRTAVQRLLRSVECISPRGSERPPHRHSRSMLAPGTYPEQRLEDDTLPFVGVVDLLEVSTSGAEITDFKSGSPSSSHEEQVLVYSALWRYDRRRNPEGRAARRLRVVYPSGPTEVAFDEDADERTRESLIERVNRAKAAIAHQIPEARPAIENCQYCSVRHLCDEYWSSSTNEMRSNLRDVEVAIEQVRTPTTARVAVLQSGAMATVFGPADVFQAGDRVRALELHESADDESGELLFRCGPQSEFFRLQTG